MSLDSRWLVLVRDTTSKNPDKWVTLSELDSYLNEDETERIIRVEEMVFAADEPDGSSLEERMDALDDTETGVVPVLMERSEVAYVATTQQGVTAKLSAVAAGVDDVGEMLQSKYMLSPVLNESDETHTRADNTFEYVDAVGAGVGQLTTIRVRKYGTGGNLWSIVTTDSVEANVLDIDTGTYTITLKEGSTGAELLEAIAADSDALSLFIWEHSGGQDDYFIPEITISTFTGGLSGHVLSSTGTQIDNAVAVVPTSGAPITAQVSATAITAEGEDEEITWTAVANGEDGNGIAIDITLSAEATDIDIIVGVNAIAVDVKTGEGTTATDVLTAVNAHATAGLLVQGALTGSGGAITADSVETGGGKDITAGLAGAIRYEADKIWISTDESTASVSNWAYALLTDPNV
jgi:hypothetical protein